MRKLPLIIGLTLVIGLVVYEAYEFVATNQGVAYYLSEPKRLFSVFGLALAGGVVALGISRMSPQAQRGLKLSALGPFALAMTAFLGLFVFYIIRLSDMMTPSATRQVVAVLAMFGAFTTVLWWEFIRAWKKGSPNSSYERSCSID